MMQATSVQPFRPPDRKTKRMQRFPMHPFFIIAPDFVPQTQAYPQTPFPFRCRPLCRRSRSRIFCPLRSAFRFCRRHQAPLQAYSVSQAPLQVFPLPFRRRPVPNRYHHALYRQMPQSGFRPLHCRSREPGSTISPFNMTEKCR